MLTIFKKLFGEKPSSAKRQLKKAVEDTNLPNIDKSYKKRNISNYFICLKDKATYEKKYLKPAMYHDKFTVSCTFSRRWQVIKYGNGKKSGKWLYEIKTIATFHNLPLVNYTNTQAKLRQLYPKLKFNFAHNYVEVYHAYETEKGKENILGSVRTFRTYFEDVREQLVANLNYAYDEIHKRR